MRQRILVGLGIAVTALMVAGLGHGFAQEPEEEGPYSYTRSGTGEGFFRFDLPAGEHACRFFTNYDQVDSFPATYMTAHAYMLDENTGQYSSFESDGIDDQDIKFVLVEGQANEGADEAGLRAARNLFTNLFSWSTRAVISDKTPRIEISLSRAFRSRGLRWTFQCIGFAWPN